MFLGALFSGQGQGLGLESMSWATYQLKLPSPCLLSYFSSLPGGPPLLLSDPQADPGPTLWWLLCCSPNRAGPRTPLRPMSFRYNIDEMPQALNPLLASAYDKILFLYGVLSVSRTHRR